MILLGCTTEPLKTSQQDLSEADILSCQEVACPEVTVTYITVEDEDELVTSINNYLQASVIKALYLGDTNDDPTANNISEAIEDFIQEYRMANAEFPDMAAEYFAEVEQEASLSTADLLSVEERLSIYTGGAHGYSAVKYLNFDRNTSELLSTEALFEDVSAVINLAEEHFRRKQNIATNESINSTGYWFENDTFSLPETVGFTKKHLILHYNAYEIASYAEGPITVEIPLKEVATYLSFSTE